MKMDIDFKKGNGLVPAIVQDADTHKVLMMGYMNEEAYRRTVEQSRVTFYSRSKKRLWIKGEESGNFLHMVDIKVDCDGDALLVKVNPAGPVCHKGTDTCWGEKNSKKTAFLTQLEHTIINRKAYPDAASYTSDLFKRGLAKTAQKVGEEAVELVIEALKENNRDEFLNESADLMYHFLVLLVAKGYRMEEVVEVLRKRSGAVKDI